MNEKIVLIDLVNIKALILDFLYELIPERRGLQSLMLFVGAPMPYNNNYFTVEFKR